MTDPANNSYTNNAEARHVVEVPTSRLDKEASFEGSYSSQVALIKIVMAKKQDFRKLAQSFPHEIEVKSVE